MLRILIADDHPIVRQGLKQILIEEFSPLHVEEAEDTDVLIEKATTADWDLIISDLAMPGGGGIVALKKVKLAKPELPFIIVSTYPADQYSARVLKAGASVYVNKDGLTTELVGAIRITLAQKLSGI